jgi:hypothetical protein
MAGTNGLLARSEQIGTGASWGWGYNLAPRLNVKFSDEQTLSAATFFQKGYWNNRTDYANRILAGSPVLDDDSIGEGTWENRRGNLTWANRFRDDRRHHPARIGMSAERLAAHRGGDVDTAVFEPDGTAVSLAADRHHEFAKGEVGCVGQHRAVMGARLPCKHAGKTAVDA